MLEDLARITNGDLAFAPSTAFLVGASHIPRISTHEVRLMTAEHSTSIDPDRIVNPSAYDFRTGGIQVWECGNASGYKVPASYCCQSTDEGTRCCSTTSALFELGAATIGNPSAITSTSESSSSKPTASNSLSTSTSGIPLSSHSVSSKMSSTTVWVTPSLPPSPSSLATSAPSAPPSSGGKQALPSIIGGVLGVIGFLCMTIGGWRFWRSKTQPRKQTGGPQWSKPELPGDAKVSSRSHHERIHEIYSEVQDRPELSAPSRHELIGDDGACEIPAR